RVVLRLFDLVRTGLIVAGPMDYATNCANMGTIRLRRDRRVLVMVAGFPRRGSHSSSNGISMPISAGITASVLYVSENGVSPLLDLTMVQCAHKICGTSSIQSLLLLSSRAFIPYLKILFALSTKPLACGCLMEAKR
ncbi:hypothetical protein Tco_0408692, partial [Tanacetum coccineum]